jgi:hypothetical protein
MMRPVKPKTALILMIFLLPLMTIDSLGQTKTVKVRISWGHESATAARYYFKLAPATPGVEARELKGESLEPGEAGVIEGLEHGVLLTTAGAGDIDALIISRVALSSACRKRPSIISFALRSGTRCACRGDTMVRVLRSTCRIPTPPIARAGRRGR